MIDISNDTRIRIGAVFHASQHARVEELLLGECGDNLPLVSAEHEELIERIRFAVLKLSKGNLESLQAQINEAKIDWRDVLVVAGFGEDTRAHWEWNPSTSP